MSFKTNWTIKDSEAVARRLKATYRDDPAPWGGDPSGKITTARGHVTLANGITFTISDMGFHDGRVMALIECPGRHEVAVSAYLEWG